MELWQEWHANNHTGYQYGSNSDEKYDMLVPPGDSFHTDIECDVLSKQNYATTKKTVRRITFRLKGNDGSCDGSLVIQYGHDNGNSHLAHDCETEVYDIQDFDAEEMYILGHALLRTARVLYFDDERVVSEQREERALRTSSSQ